MTCSYIPDSLPVLNSSYKELILVAFIQAMHKTKTQTENHKIVHVNKKEYQRKVTTLKLFTSYCRYSRLQKSCNKQAEQWKTTIDLPRMSLVIFPPQHALPLGSNITNQLWFSTVQLACCKTFAICCTDQLVYSFQTHCQATTTPHKAKTLTHKTLGQ